MRVITLIYTLFLSRNSIRADVINAHASARVLNENVQLADPELTIPENDIYSERNLLFDQEIELEEKGDPFSDVKFVVHRNGDAMGCGESKNDVDELAAFREALKILNHSPILLKKHEVDALLTTTLAYYLLDWNQCYPNAEGYMNGASPELVEYCYMGEKRTPILPDHRNIVALTKNNGEVSLPCHFHTREGLRITSMKQLADFARQAKTKETVEEQVCTVNGTGAETCETKTKPELHLYAVPAGRMFMFAPSYVGEVFELKHVSVPGNLPVSLKVISLQPRVFDVYNFCDEDEAGDIVQRILQEKSETHKMKRSSTGAVGYTVNNKRTSENGFDVSSKTALAVKRRCFTVLGFDEYHESFADGLQVLRYNQTTAYTPHHDYLDDPSGKDEHDYESQDVGTNRFATILLYMSDIPEGGGGQTVFPNAWPAGEKEEDHVQLEQALKNVRESGESKLFKSGSWEEEMVAQCSSRLVIKPYSSRAVLFYSQHPDGSLDDDSIHGGCPVLEGTKWAANLWVWNGPRSGYENAPINHEAVERNRKNGKSAPTNNIPDQLQGRFTNTGKDPNLADAELYYRDMFWGKFGHGEVHQVNTFEGHEWNVRVGEEVVHTWVIDGRREQHYEV